MLTAFDGFVHTFLLSGAVYLPSPGSLSPGIGEAS